MKLSASLVVRLAGFVAALGAVATPAMGAPLPTADSAFASFSKPQRAFSPVPIWWWSGEKLDVRRLEWQLDRMVEGHVYNAVVLNLAPVGPMYGSQPDDPPFYSEEWWRIMKRVLNRARALGIRIWLYDQLGFSTANIQGRLMARHPECRSVALARLEQEVGTGSHVVRVPEGSGRPVVGAAALQLGSTGAPNGKVVDLTAGIRGRTVVATLPEGRWRLVAWYEVPGGFDYMNPRSGARLLDFVHGEMERRLGKLLGTTVAGTFQDELGAMNRWTEALPAEFKQRCGYTISGALPALTYDLGAATVRARCDLANVQASLLERAFFVPLYQWHQRHGMLCSYDQVTRDADPITAQQTYVDYFRTMRWFTVPGNDQTGSTRPHSSIAHHYNGRRVWLEGFYGAGWGQSVEDLAGRIGSWYADGANLYNPHAFYYSTRAGWWEWAPPCTSFRQPYWRHYPLLADQVARMSSLLTQGAHRCDVAVVYPAATVQAGLGMDGAVEPRAKRARDAYVAVTAALDARGIDYDILDEPSLGRAVAKQGQLQVSGEGYRAVVVPGAEVLAGASCARLAQLVSAGGMVAIYRGAPSACAGPGGQGALVLLQAMLPRSTSSIVVARKGAGLVIRTTGEAGLLAQWLDRRLGRQAEGEVRCRRSALADADLFYVAATPGRGRRVVFRATGAPEIWSPWTGQARRAVARPVGSSRTAVYVPFDESPTQFVLFRHGQPGMSSMARKVAAGPGPRATSFVSPARPTTQRTLLTRTSKPMQPISVAGNWQVRLIPTIDNRWGDFALPASTTSPPPECRTFRYREEKVGENGAELGWAEPNAPDGDWSTVVSTYGPYWWISRLDAPVKMVSPPGPDTGPWTADRNVWSPWSYSQRLGVPKDPTFLADLGPKGRVPDAFLDFGMAKGGTRRMAVTFLHSQSPVSIDLDAAFTGQFRVAVNGEWLEKLPATVSLMAGYNAIAAEVRHEEDRRLTGFVRIGPPVREGARPAWIWLGSPSDGDQVRYFRAPLRIDEVPERVEVVVTADNGYELSVNGHVLGSDSGPAIEVWSRGERYAIQKFLHVGENIIAIKARNTGDRAGVLAVVRAGQGDDLGRRMLVTGPEWRVSDIPPPADWVREEFDDREWRRAQVVGQYGDGPWGRIANMEFLSPAVLPESGWLNGDVTPMPAGVTLDARPGLGKNVGWYRFRTPPGCTTMDLNIWGRYQVFINGVPVDAPRSGIVPIPAEAQAMGAICAIRIAQVAGRYAGAAFATPVRFTTTLGSMPPGPWADHGLQHWSGGVRYEKSVDLPAAWAGAAAVLDLGRVRGTAEVAVNGQPAGVRLWRPYRFDISRLVRPGTNRITVLVTNTLAPFFGDGYPTPYAPKGQMASGMLGPVQILEPSGERTRPQAVTSGLVDWASPERGATASASSEFPGGKYPAASVLVGDTSGRQWAMGGGWNDATEGEFPDWIRVSFSTAHKLKYVKVWTLAPIDQLGLAAFDVECMVDGEWVRVARVDDVTDACTTVTLAPTVSDAVRIVVHDTRDGAYSRIVSLQVWGDP